MIARLLRRLLPLRSLAWCFGCLWGCNPPPPPEECIVDENDFATYSGFTTISGSWSASGTLTTSSSLARTTCNTNSPTAERVIRVELKTSSNQAVSVRIGDHRATITFNATTGNIQLLDASLSVLASVTDVTITPDTFVEANVCYDGTTLSAFLTDNPASYLDANATITDLTNGLSTGFINTNPFYFDNWKLTGNTGEPGCACPSVPRPTAYCATNMCIDGIIPYHMLVEHEDCTGSYAFLNGAYVFTLCFVDPVTGSTEVETSCRWYYHRGGEPSAYAYELLQIESLGVSWTLQVGPARLSPPKCRGLSSNTIVYTSTVALNDVDCTAISRHFLDPQTTIDHAAKGKAYISS